MKLWGQNEKGNYVDLAPRYRDLVKELEDTQSHIKELEKKLGRQTKALGTFDNRLIRLTNFCKEIYNIFTAAKESLVRRDTRGIRE